MLTRPDAPAGRGRTLTPSRAKETAQRLGIPVLEPERLEPGLDLGAPVVVAVAYGLIVPEPLLAERLWLNVHPSLLPRWRGAAPVERALMAGDPETGVYDHQAGEGARRGADRGAGGIPAPARGRRGFGVRARRRAGFTAAGPSCSPIPSRRSASRRGSRRTPPRSQQTTGASTWAAPPRELVDHVRALSPHIGARAEIHGRGVTIWKARVGRRRFVRARSRSSRTAAVAMTYDAWRRGLRRVSPARAAAYAVLVRVFEEGAYADRALRTAAAGLDERDRALAQRLAYGAVQRARTLDHAIQTLGRRRVHRLDPPVRAALRLGAYQLGIRPRRRAVRGSERVRRARPPGGPRARRGVHERRTPSPGGRHRPAPRLRSPSRPRRKQLSSTPTRTGSQTCGGVISDRTRRSSSCGR